MKFSLKQFIKNKPSLSLFLFSFVAIFFLELFFCQLSIGDDVVFSNALSDKSLKQFLVDRYNWWSSRVFLEALMMPIIVYIPPIWYFINALIAAFILTYSQRFISKEPHFGFGVFFSLLLLFLIPYKTYGESGWITDTVNYLWAWAFALIVFYPLFQLIEGKKTGIPMYILSLISALFAMNNEQLAALCLGLLIVGIIYYVTLQKKFPFFMIPHIVINISLLAFELLSPGNSARLTYETAKYMPEFVNFSTLDKILNGFINVFYVYTNGLEHQYLLIAFILTLIIYGLVKRENMIYILISFLPLTMILISKILFELFKRNMWNKGLRYLGSLWYNRLYTSAESPAQSVFQLIYYLIILLSILICLLHYSKNFVEGIFQCIIFIAAIAVSTILGFSPTIFASGQRIFLFGNYLIIILMVRLLFNCWSQLRKNTK